MNASRSSLYPIIVLVILVSIVLWLAAPPLLRAIVQMLQEPVPANQIDLRPIPVPAPLPPVAAQLPLIETPSPAAAKVSSVPEAVAAPTPPTPAMKMAASSAGHKTPDSLTPVRVTPPNLQEITGTMLISVLLLGLMWLHAAPDRRSVRRRCI